VGGNGHQFVFLFSPSGMVLASGFRTQIFFFFPLPCSLWLRFPPQCPLSLLPFLSLAYNCAVMGLVQPAAPNHTSFFIESVFTKQPSLPPPSSAFLPGIAFPHPPPTPLDAKNNSVQLQARAPLRLSVSASVAKVSFSSPCW